MQAVKRLMPNWTAAMIIWLFAFILVEKMLHVHCKVIHNNNAQEALYQHLHCPVCDFQLAADADLPYASDLIMLPLWAATQQVRPCPEFTSLKCMLPAHRGPPVF